MDRANASDFTERAKEAAQGLKARYDQLPRAAKATLLVVAFLAAVGTLTEPTPVPVGAPPGPSYGAYPVGPGYPPQPVPNVPLQTEMMRGVLTNVGQNTIDMSRAMQGYRP